MKQGDKKKWVVLLYTFGTGWTWGKIVLAPDLEPVLHDSETDALEYVLQKDLRLDFTRKEIRVEPYDPEIHDKLKTTS
jgi:hypothetical protein